MFSSTHPVNRESSRSVFPAPALKPAPFIQAMNSICSVGVQPVSQLIPAVKLSPDSMPVAIRNTCLATLWKTLNERNEFTREKDFQHKQTWVEDLLVTLPVDELKNVQPGSLFKVFEIFKFKFDVSEITVRNALQVIKAEPDDEQTRWFTEYIKTHPFKKDGDEVIATRWVKEMYLERQKTKEIFTTPVLRRLMRDNEIELTSVCLQHIRRNLKAIVPSEDIANVLKIYGNIKEVNPIWRLYILLTNNDYPQKLANEASLLCIFKGREKEFCLNKSIINKAIVIFHAKSIKDSPLDSWLEGWYANNKNILDQDLNVGNLVSTLLSHLSCALQNQLITEMDVQSKLTAANLLVFLRQKKLLLSFDCAEDTVKLFNLCADVSITQQQETVISVSWENYAAQRNITVERKIGKTMLDCGIGVAVLARYFLNNNINFSYHSLLTAQQIVEEELPGSGTLDWLRTNMRNINNYHIRNKSQWLKNILIKDTRPEEITAMVRNKYTKKLLLAIWQTPGDISYNTLDKLLKKIRKLPDFSSASVAATISEAQPTGKATSVPESIAQPQYAQLPLNAVSHMDEETLIFFEDNIWKPHYLLEAYLTLEPHDILIGSEPDFAKIADRVFP